MRIETITNTVYVSDDGLYYDNEADCLKHEKEMRSNLLEELYWIPHDIATESEMFMWSDCGTFGYVFIRPRNKTEIDYIKEWLKQFRRFDSLEMDANNTYILEVYFSNDDVSFERTFEDIENVNDVWSFADFMNKLNSPFYAVQANLKRNDCKENNAK